MHILIVEDDKDLRDSYVKQIKLFNLDQKEINLTYDLAKNYEEGNSLLDNNYDIVILDLKLVKGGVDYKGKELLTKVKGELRYIAYVITGNPEVIEEESANQNTFFKIRVKGEANADFTLILNELVNIFNTGITKILSKKGKIEQYLNDIFWKHLSNSLDLWVNDNTRTAEEKEKSLIRYTILHMQEYIDEEVENYHPSEFYITRPIKEYIFTGDIVYYSGCRYLILTPSCDIVLRHDGTRNTNFILLCKVQNLMDIIPNFNQLESKTGKKNDNRIRINNYFQNKKQNYHFIPRSNSIEAGLIDFQDKMTLPENAINDLVKSGEIDRIATISAPFLKDIISRYANYYSRQGSPDFLNDELYSNLFD